MKLVTFNLGCSKELSPHLYATITISFHPQFLRMLCYYATTTRPIVWWKIHSKVWMCVQNRSVQNSLKQKRNSCDLVLIKSARFIAQRAGGNGCFSWYLHCLHFMITWFLDILCWASLFFDVIWLQQIRRKVCIIITRTTQLKGG